MSQGLQIFDANGNVTFDSNLAVGGVCLGFFTGSHSTDVYTFPDFAGCTLTVFVTNGVYMGVIDTNLGYPRITFPSTADLYATATFCIFAK